MVMIKAKKKAKYDRNRSVTHSCKIVFFFSSSSLVSSSSGTQKGYSMLVILGLEKLADWSLHVRPPFPTKLWSLRTATTPGQWVPGAALVWEQSLKSPSSSLGHLAPEIQRGPWVRPPFWPLGAALNPQPFSSTYASCCARLILFSQWY